LAVLSRGAAPALSKQRLFLLKKRTAQFRELTHRKGLILPSSSGKKSVGYSKERIDSLTSTEVVGMIKNYTKFYMPKMLHPGEEEKKE
jgi:hypothetical protein